MANTFDKANEKPKPSHKQYVLLGVAAVGLVGVMVMQWNHKFPSAANAAALDNGVSAMPVDSDADSEPGQITQQARQALAEDPTAAIPLDGDRGMNAMADAPGNPFALSAVWYKELHKPDAPVVHVSETAQPSQPQAQPAKIEPFTLQGIMKTQQGRVAIVDGDILGPGSVTHGVKVIKVLEDRIVVRPLNASGAETFEVILQDK